MKEKNKRNDLQSEDREIPNKASVSDEEPRVMSFDVYFLKLMAVDNKVHNHHKAPMKSFAEQKGLMTGTEEQFDEIFGSY